MAQDLPEAPPKSDQELLFSCRSPIQTLHLHRVNVSRSHLRGCLRISSDYLQVRLLGRRTKRSLRSKVLRHSPRRTFFANGRREAFSRTGGDAVEAALDPILRLPANAPLVLEACLPSTIVIAIPSRSSGAGPRCARFHHNVQYEIGSCDLRRGRISNQTTAMEHLSRRLPAGLEAPEAAVR